MRGSRRVSTPLSPRGPAHVLPKHRSGRCDDVGTRAGSATEGSKEMARRPRSIEQRLSLGLERIHQVPFGEATWESALTAVCDFLGAECADLTFSDPVLQQLRRWEQSRIDAKTVEEYTQVYMAANWTEVHPRVPVALRMRQGQVVA